MSESIAGDPAPQACGNLPFTLRSELKRTAEQFVFLDVADAGSGAFWLEYACSGLHWGDSPPTRHGMGTDFVFADQHVEYRKWTDTHTLWVLKNYQFNSTAGPYIDNCDCDLRWINKVTWGKVNPAFNCATSKKCDY